MPSIIPPKLPPNGTIGIVAPSGSFSRERLQPAYAYLHNKGFTLIEGQALYKQNRYLAGTDEERANDLNSMFSNPNVHAIMVTRGGYGAARILDLLDWEMIRQNPKPLIGLSDTTALQLGLLAKTYVVSYSGLALCSDITSAGIDPVTEKAIWNALFYHAFEPIDGLIPIRPGTLTGTLVGGCLSLVASLIGTAYLPDFKQAIIFLEDINEPPYRVDRMLNQMLMAGIFEHASGVIFGQFVGGEPDKKEEGSLQDVFEDFAQRVPIPVYTNLHYGHGKSRRVIPIGQTGKVTDNKLTIGSYEA